MLISKKPAIYMLLTFSFFASFVFGIPAFADEAQMKETLIKIINQLQAIKPLINEAENEQPKNSIIQIHFEKFEGEDGKIHNGLRQDIEGIQKALILATKRQKIEPRKYKPIKHDFIKSEE